MLKESPDLLGIVGALVISFVSGFISISRRVLQGYPASFLWVTSEFLTAILCGYLMYYSYPTIQEDMPKWFTMPVAVAISAHIGGRLFQEVEAWLVRRYKLISAMRRNDDFDL